MWSFRDPDFQRLYNFPHMPLKLEAENIMGSNHRGEFYRPGMGLKVAHITSGHTPLIRTQYYEHT